MKLRQITQEGLLFVFPNILAVLAILGSSVFGIDLGSGSISPYRILSILSPIYLLVYFYQNRLSPPRGRAFRDRYWLYVIGFFVFWVLYALLSIVWAEYRSGWFRHIFLLTMGAMNLIVILLYTREKTNYRCLAGIILGLVIILCLLAWYELAIRDSTVFSGWDDGYERVQIYNSRRQPVLWFGNTNNFAFVLIISLAAAFPLVLGKGWLWKALYALAFVLASSIIVQTSSRGAMVSLLLFTGALMLFWLYEGLRFGVWRLIALPVLLAVALLIPVPKVITTNANYSASVANVAKAMGSTSSFLGILADDQLPSPTDEGAMMDIDDTNQRGSIRKGSTAIRVDLVRRGLNLVVSTRGLGVGAGNAEHWMRKADMYIESMHNYWVEILAVYGIPVFLPYMALLAFILVDMLKKAISSIHLQTRWQANSVIAFFVQFAMAAMSPSSLFNVEYHWIILGLVFGYVARVIQTPEDMGNAASAHSL